MRSAVAMHASMPCACAAPAAWQRSKQGREAEPRARDGAAAQAVAAAARAGRVRSRVERRRREQLAQVTCRRTRALRHHALCSIGYGPTSPSSDIPSECHRRHSFGHHAYMSFCLKAQLDAF